MHVGRHRTSADTGWTKAEVERRARSLNLDAQATANRWGDRQLDGSRWASFCGCPRRGVALPSTLTRPLAVNVPDVTRQLHGTGLAPGAWDHL